MRRRATAALAFAALAFVVAALAVPGVSQAITFGQLDTTNRFPQVGGLVAEFDGEKFLICSGTLIADDVFLTASHCTVLESVGPGTYG